MIGWVGAPLGGRRGGRVEVTKMHVCGRDVELRPVVCLCVSVWLPCGCGRTGFTKLDNDFL